MATDRARRKASRRSTPTGCLPTDQELIHSCLQGSAAAWDDLVERYKRLVYSVPLRHGLSHSDAEDVFQAVFIALYRNLASIRDRTRLAAWLVTTARRESYQIRRRTRDETCLPLDVLCDRESVEGLIEQAERCQVVQEAVRRLPKRDQDLVQALFFDAENVDYATVSESLDMKIGSIGPTRQRILKKLLVILKSMGYVEAASFGDASTELAIAC